MEFFGHLCSVTMVNAFAVASANLPPVSSAIPAADAALNASAVPASSLAAMLVCGLLLIPLVYDVLFYRILRQRFILLHAGMVVAMLAHTVTTPALAPLAFPGLSEEVVGRANIIAFAISVSFALLFAGGMIERRFRSVEMETALAAAAIFVLVATVLALLIGMAPRLADNQIYLVTYLVPAAVLTAILVFALGRGSRSASWLALALSGAFAVSIALFLDALGVMQLAVSAASLVLLAFVVQAVVTSLGVGDRFLGIRQDLDRARVRAHEMGEMARTDGLTGLLNRRVFEQIEWLERGEGLLVADIDRFKPINDTYGHQAGDVVLRNTAEVLQDVLAPHPGAQLFRLGGEEFAIVCEAGRAAQLMTMAEEVRERIADQIVEADGEQLPPITISVGAVLGRGQRMHEAFAEADSALYGAKAMGRDRSVLYRHNPNYEELPGDETPNGFEAT